MRRTIVGICCAFFTFLIGGTAAVLYYWVIPSNHAIKPVPTVLESVIPQFTPTGSLLEDDYSIYWFSVPGNNDPEGVDLFNTFRSAEYAHKTFESNATADGLIERGVKYDPQGKLIGERGITIFHAADGREGPARI